MCSRTRRAQLQRAFWGSQHDPRKPIAVWIDSLKTMAKYLAGIGLPPKKWQIADSLIIGLDESWATIRDELLQAPKEVLLADAIFALELFGIITLAQRQ